MNRLAETSDWLFIEKQAQVPTRVLLARLRQEHPSAYFAPIYNLDDELSGPLLIGKNAKTTQQGPIHVKDGILIIEKNGVIPDNTIL